MNRPSRMGMSNTVSIYSFVPTYDADAGVDSNANNYTTPIALNVNISVQPGEPYQQDDFANRVTETTPYTLFLNQSFNLKQKDLVVWVDQQGITHNIYLDAPSQNQAGKGAAFEWTGLERRTLAQS